jgi:drug/metabolite transporter (DMT)-like permease
VAASCLVGAFPIFVAIALQTVPASHGGVVLGIMPLTTALLSALIAGERPSPAFWAAALVGAALVVGFVMAKGGGGLEFGDLFLIAAVITSSLGYVVSGQLAQRGYAGWEVISWVVVVSLPVTVPAGALDHAGGACLGAGWSWVGFTYVT